MPIFVVFRKVFERCTPPYGPLRSCGFYWQSADASGFPAASNSLRAIHGGACPRKRYVIASRKAAHRRGGRFEGQRRPSSGLRRLSYLEAPGLGGLLLATRDQRWAARVASLLHPGRGHPGRRRCAGVRRSPRHQYCEIPTALASHCVGKVIPQTQKFVCTCDGERCPPCIASPRGPVSFLLGLRSPSSPFGSSRARLGACSALSAPPQKPAEAPLYVPYVHPVVAGCRLLNDGYDGPTWINGRARVCNDLKLGGVRFASELPGLRIWSIWTVTHPTLDPRGIWQQREGVTQSVRCMIAVVAACAMHAGLIGLP